MEGGGSRKSQDTATKPPDGGFIILVAGTKDILSTLDE
jgi:hypothetical protein